MSSTTAPANEAVLRPNEVTADLVTLPRRHPLVDGQPVRRKRASRPHLARCLARWSRREGPRLFAAFTAIYLAAAIFLVSHNIVFADALSRVGNGFYVLYSRDPHLPAVGFVWNPLPSLVLLPLFPFKALLPELVTRGFAGNISSSLFMAGAVVLMASCLRRLGVGRAGRIALTCLFGVQPMILLYASSGLSEPMLLFFLLLTVDALIAWAQDGRPGRLVTAGLALGLAYMTRYEAVGPAVAVAALVGLISSVRANGGWRTRTQVALNDAALVAGPFVFAFVLWSVSAKILVNEWLPTFTSQYGNSAQVSSGRTSIQSVTGSTLPQAAVYAGRQITGLAPLFLPLIVLSLVVALRRRQLTALIAPAVLGAVLVLDNLILLEGKSFGWLRFQIAVIPLSILLAGTVLAALWRPRGARLRTASGGLRAAGAVVVVAMVALAAPAQFRTLTTTNNGGLAREEGSMLRSTFFPSLATKEEHRSLHSFQTERQISGYLDSLRLPPGSVLADTAYAYSVVLSSNTPKQFVITSDRDFHSAVRDPSGHHVEYMLVPAPNLGPADALGKQWPDLYRSGGGVAVLTKEWHGVFYGDWRLYRVDNPTSPHATS